MHDLIAIYRYILLMFFFQVYIQYMKFARRAEGIKSARQVFKMAREDKRSTYHVFMAAALMEYYCSKVRNQNFVCLKMF